MPETITDEVPPSQGWLYSGSDKDGYEEYGGSKKRCGH